MSKRIDQLTAATDEQVKDPTWLWAVGDPATGQLYKATQAQLRAAYGPNREVYTATGAEGNTITIPDLAGKTIFLILRESGPIYEVETSPDGVSYVWDGTDIELGMAAGPGERFIILHHG